MQSDREQIDTALLALLQSANYSFAKPGSRHAAIWPEVGSADLPCWFLVFFAEQSAQPQAYGASAFERYYRIIVDAQIDPTDPGGTAKFANGVLAAFEAVLFNSYQPQTLGGLVTHCWIEGTAWALGGTLAQQVTIEIPIKVLCGE